jgi:hypothetical protein
MTDSGCLAPVQCVVSASVILSAALHKLKYGSTETIGTAGGRKSPIAHIEHNASEDKSILRNINIFYSISF